MYDTNPFVVRSSNVILSVRICKYCANSRIDEVWSKSHAFQKKTKILNFRTFFFLTLWKKIPKFAKILRSSATKRVSFQSSDFNLGFGKLPFPLKSYFFQFHNPRTVKITIEEFCTTCRRFTKLRIFNTFDYKYRQNLVSKIINSDKSQTPQFRETAVSGSAFYSVTFFRLKNTLSFPSSIIKNCK